MNFKKLSIAALMVLFVVGLTACDKPSPAEKAGQDIDNAAENLGDKVEDATDKAGDKLEQAGDKVENATD